jgi:hypothetical protein
MLLKVTPKGSIGISMRFIQPTNPLWFSAVFERLRAVLNDCDAIQERTQYMVETMLHIRKTKFEVNLC